MLDETSPNTPAQTVEKPAPRRGVTAAIEQDMLLAEQHIETWFQDLLASLPHLRETATYNHLRSAIDDLKKRLT
ncbi:MAG: hypothetical protein M0Z99_12530 [Betaproteobacteria bacterium]|nr:hypothetical protein [Betaproteobacteria bacterium]